MRLSPHPPVKSVVQRNWNESSCRYGLLFLLIMRSSLPVVFLCLTSGFLASSFKLMSDQWSKLILTHHWPETFCIKEQCSTDLNYWTLHGLWPNKGAMCNSSWHFNASQIQDLMPEMEKYWPDLLSKGPTISTAFWKHEWVKHGTCAASLEALDSEHKYFSKALELYQKLDLNGTLRKANIIPRKTNYTLEQIEGAIINHYAVRPKIQCIQEQGEEAQILGQIEICFNREFQLMNCENNEYDNWYILNDVLPSDLYTSGYHVCDQSSPVFYPPLQSKK
ncbi:ribonuclease T2-like [Arapaima gigas]